MRKWLWIIALAVLAWIFVVPSCSAKFGCEAAGATAHAASEDCPSSLRAAAGDPEWAAARIASIATEPITTGLLYDDDGTEIEIDSKQSGEHFDLALSYLRPMLGNAARQAAGHVEPKAVALMRNGEQAYAVLVINNPQGPCGYTGGIGCERLAELMLPAGSELVVWWPGGNHRTLTGKAES